MGPGFGASTIRGPSRPNFSVSNDGNSQSRERKFSQKIYVDGLFPSHVRPASVLIGTKGMNHNKMQTSGCTVQLRGKGCSQPSSQWPEEPVHLFVKYDTDDQFDRFKDILKEIVEGYETQNPKRPRAVSKPRLNTLPTPPHSSVPISITGWNPQTYTESMLNAEADLLWLFRIFLIKEHSVYLDDLPMRVASFFCMDSIEPQLNNTCFPSGPNQLRDFVRSCPHFLVLTLEPGISIGPDGEIPAWSRPSVSLSANMGAIQKDNLKELHKLIRKEQTLAFNCFQNNQHTSDIHHVTQQQTSDVYSDNLKTTLIGTQSYTTPLLKQSTLSTHSTNQYQQSTLGNWESKTEPSPCPLLNEQDNYSELSALCLLLQALHFLIREVQETTFIGLEERFLTRFELPLKVSVFGYTSVVAFVKAYPTIFRVTGSGRDMKVSALPNPNFSSFNTMTTSSGNRITTRPLINNTHSHQRHGISSVDSLLGCEILSTTPSNYILEKCPTVGQIPSSVSSQDSHSHFVETTTTPMGLLMTAAQTLKQSSTFSTNNGPITNPTLSQLSGGSEHTVTHHPNKHHEPPQPSHNILSVERNAPRLLGLLGKLVKQ